MYGIRVATNKSTVGQSPASDILIRLNLNGEMGDIGQRALVPDPLDMDGSIDIVGLQSSFKENAVSIISMVISRMNKIIEMKF